MCVIIFYIVILKYYTILLYALYYEYTLFYKELIIQLFCIKSFHINLHKLSILLSRNLLKYSLINLIKSGLRAILDKTDNSTN